MIRARLAELQLAVMLLTRAPAGRLPEPAPAIAAAAWAFPLAGLVPGLLGAAVLASGLPVMLAAGLALAAQMAVTGALHEDGLADVADGFWGGRTRDRRLEIMRDSRIGSYGTLALIVAAGLRWQAMALAGPVALILAAVASRVAPVALMATLPPARSDGMGHAARAVTAGPLALAALIGLGPLILCGQVPAVAVAAAVVIALALIARRKIGGQTGDVLGAGQQLAEIALLIALI
ncbi:adenosylcobinamide-GDP ribazoletransferase [Paenirhodobacter sp.]|uniref:adenosylcobinamide-GDP ribazoletransferase n=1 Tax=Paenirhodobacter sp. TaxID=1965326 RepID=UPI003B3F6AA1